MTFGGYLQGLNTDPALEKSAYMRQHYKSGARLISVPDPLETSIAEHVFSFFEQFYVSHGGDVKARCVGMTRSCVSLILSGDIMGNRWVAENLFRHIALNLLNPGIISLRPTFISSRWLGAYPSSGGILLGSD